MKTTSHNSDGPEYLIRYAGDNNEARRFRNFSNRQNTKVSL